MLQIKRIYDDSSKTDGFRVLVDRLWPRGVSKEDANLDLWLKEIAPSADLRTWFGHKPERFNEFKARYLDELANNPAVAELKGVVARHPTVTLLYGAKDSKLNNAVILQDFLK